MRKLQKLFVNTMLLSLILTILAIPTAMMLMMKYQPANNGNVLSKQDVRESTQSTEE